MDFQGKRALVTGASRGIGRGVGQMLAAGGARVAVHYVRDAAGAQATLGGLAGDGHAVVQADIADPAQVKRMVDEAADALGGLDILINNAGIYTEHPIMETDYDEWLRQWNMIIQTNLLGAANAIFCAVPHFVQQGGGAVVNVSSRGAFRGEPLGPGYGASKAGMNSMGQSLALALAPQNIHVITVAPGWVETDMAAEHLASPAGDATRNQSPFGRVASVDDVAYAVCFAASDRAKFMTGAVLDVNGASYLRT
ncbi:MAG: SDR family oxidoreductase [Anaerolineae bacterium]|jgi:NAD(P)-dependent dehydrogenase (short-subunit alcohol dehydrogenase family)|nr:SDR family oxidoreductase [Anaerolineae bacterium]